MIAQMMNISQPILDLLILYFFTSLWIKIGYFLLFFVVFCDFGLFGAEA